MAGKALFPIGNVAVRGVLCEISGDLDEYPKTLGLPEREIT